jgi:hypothetical protein
MQTVINIGIVALAIVIGYYLYKNHVEEAKEQYNKV